MGAKNSTDGGTQGKFRQKARGQFRRKRDDPAQSLLLYGLHTVQAALNNPNRKLLRLCATKNALSRLDADLLKDLPLEIEICLPRDIDRLVGKDAVHQGIALETLRLEPGTIDELDDARLVLVLDQVTDPHNVGAILRSAVALGANAVVTTSRHSAPETGVLAKSASGALDHVTIIEVRNLANALEQLHQLGFQTVGLDSEGYENIKQCLTGSKIALVLGAEGKGLRQKTRETCNVLARLELPGSIVSLNVSNAAALALFLAREHLSVC